MGYSPWSCKESDKTEATRHACRKRSSTSNGGQAAQARAQVLTTASLLEGGFCSPGSHTPEVDRQHKMQEGLLRWLSAEAYRTVCWRRGRLSCLKASCEQREVRWTGILSEQ